MPKGKVIRVSHEAWGWLSERAYEQDASIARVVDALLPPDAIAARPARARRSLDDVAQAVEANTTAIRRIAEIFRDHRHQGILTRGDLQAMLDHFEQREG